MFRLIWKSAIDEEQEDWRVLRHEDFEEGRYYQAQAGRPCDIGKHYPRRYRSSIPSKNTIDIYILSQRLDSRASHKILAIFIS